MPSRTHLPNPSPAPATFGRWASIGCGDVTGASAVLSLMQGEATTLMFTSPPYAQQRDYGAAKESSEIGMR